METLHPVLNAPPELLMELALGLDTFENICRRYEYDDDQIAELKRDKGTAARIKRLEAELQKDGVTLKHRASYALEDLIGVIWQRAKRGDTNLDLTIKSAKLLAEVSGVTAQANQVQQTGPGFSVNIMFADGSQAMTIGQSQQPAHRTIDITPTKNSVLALPEDWTE